MPVSSKRNKNPKEYTAWSNMIQRCLNPKNPRYKDYGGRGVTVCVGWLLYDNFFFDMGVCPDGLTLDRIDNSLGYFPENCKWSTRSEQQINRRIRSDNTTGFKGLYYDKRRDSWVARFKGKYLGAAKSPTEAITIYDRHINIYNT